MFQGLTHRFILDKGKFTFTAAGEKVKSDLHFFLVFNHVKRVYLPEYDPELHWYLQRTSNDLDQYRTLMLGNLQKKIIQFVPYIKINSLDAWFERRNKSYGVLVNFMFQQDPEKPLQTVIFI